MERAETTVLVSPLLFKVQHTMQLCEKPSRPECAAFGICRNILGSPGSRFYQFTDLTGCVDLVWCVGVWFVGWW